MLSIKYSIDLRWAVTRPSEFWHPLSDGFEKSFDRCEVFESVLGRFESNEV